MSRNRWVERVLRGSVAVALAGLVGCKQPTFMSEADFQQVTSANLPPRVETNPHATILPPTVSTLGKKPSDVLDPSREARNVTLKECIAIALEQGNVGSQSPFQFGNKNELTGNPNGTSGPDAIRAFALDPATASASIERALSRFDARWVTQMIWQKVDQPVAAQFLSFQQQRDGASFSTRLDKPLPSGGLAGITFNVDYSKFAQIPQNQQQGFVNPNYTPRLTFSFQQPLLRQFGVEVNQMNDFHPGRGDGADFNFPVGSSPFASNLPGQGSILVTRIRRDQSLVSFESQVNSLLANIETAYWNLYAAYYNLYAQEKGLEQSYDGYRFVEARVKSGSDPARQLDQARAQLEGFRAQVYQARDQVLESERQLRGFMGLRSDDGQRLVPIDEPNLAPFTPDFYEAANETMAYKPELMILRQEVKISQLQLRLSRNLRQPDLRLIANYDVAGLGTRLDGSELIGDDGTTPGNALASFGNNQFNSWDLRLRLDVPIGFRDLNAQVRQAQLQLTRNYINLRDGEMKALEYLTQQYRRVIVTHAVIPPLKARREALQAFLHRFRVFIETGGYRPEEYLNFLTANRDLADAIRQEYAAIAQYNAALAQFEFAKGTIQRYNNISLQEGALPPGVLRRAADHERERSAAIKLRERPSFDTAPLSPPGEVAPVGGSPTLPKAGEAVPPAPLQFDPTVPKKDVPQPAPKKDAPPAPVPNPKPVIEIPANPISVTVPAPVTIPAETVFQPTGDTITVPRFQPVNRGGSTDSPRPFAPAPSPTPAPVPGIPATLPGM